MKEEDFLLIGMMAGIPLIINKYSQTLYFIKAEECLGFVLNIDIYGNVVNGYTKNALLDYISKAQYTASKTLMYIKYPEIIRKRNEQKSL